MRYLKDARAGDMIVSLFDCPHDLMQVVHGETLRGIHREQRSLQVLGAKVSIWASVTVSNTRFIRRKNLLTTTSDVHQISLRRGQKLLRLGIPSRGIICALPFQSVRMSYVIFVFLVELVVRFCAQRLSPECNRLVDRETQNL